MDESGGEDQWRPDSEANTSRIGQEMTTKTKALQKKPTGVKGSKIDRKKEPKPLETQKITVSLQRENEVLKTHIKDLMETMTKMAEQIDKYEKTIQEFREQMQASGAAQKDKKRKVARAPSTSSLESERDTRRNREPGPSPRRQPSKMTRHQQQLPRLWR